MLEKFLKQTKFSSQEDFIKNFHINVPENFNFGYDVVDEWARIAPDKKALCWTNEEDHHIDFTFADIKRESDKTASFFLSLGIKRGDMVMLILKRRYEFWFSIIALHKIGAVCIPATHLLTEKDIIYRCNAADIKMIVAVGEEPVIGHINRSVADSPSLQYRVSIGPTIPEGWLDFHAGIEAAAPFERPALANTNDDTSLLYFTSGTTGNPKMVAHDFTYPLGHIVTGSYWHNLNEESLHLTLADTGWGKAVWGKLYGQWIAGANVFVYDFGKFVPAHVLAMIEKYHITSFCAPPTVFRFLIREDISKYDISSLRYCTIAGEALNPKVYEEFYRITGIKLMEGFGQTETTLTIATYPWVEPKPGSMGIPNPQYDVDLLTSDGRWAEDGEHIKSSGYRIGPFEVESALMTHPAVVECAITGVPDEIRGQVVKATIVLSKEYKARAGEELIKEIQDHVKHVTAPYKYPRIVEFVDELPKTISGKIRRVEIREKSNH